MRKEKILRQSVTCVASVILFACGFSQVFVSGVYVVPLDLVHLVFQILAGIWSMFTGILCFLQSWSSNSGGMLSLGRRVAILLDFILEILATFLLVINEAGINVSISHYLPFAKVSKPEDLTSPSKDLMFLTGSGSLSIFMGMVILICNLRRLQKEEIAEDDRSVVTLSVRWVFKDFSPEEISQNRHRFGCHKNNFDVPNNLEPTVSTFDPNSVEFQPRGVDTLTTPMKNTAQNSTYIRLLKVDDIPIESLCCSPQINNMETTAPPVGNLWTTPTRTPIKVSTPIPPTSFGNRRVLSFPLPPNCNISLSLSEVL